MAKKELTATHSRILDILTWNGCAKKHINYVSKCIGCDSSTFQGLGETYSLLIDLKNRRLVLMDHQLIDRPEDTYWEITDKGKDFLSNL